MRRRLSVEELFPGKGIRADFLDAERRSMGERWFNQEYRCSFEDCTDAVFSFADIQAALRDDVTPLFPRGQP